MIKNWLYHFEKLAGMSFLKLMFSMFSDSDDLIKKFGRTGIKCTVKISFKLQQPLFHMDMVKELNTWKMDNQQQNKYLIEECVSIYFVRISIQVT